MKNWNPEYEKFLLDIAHKIKQDYEIKAIIKGNIELDNFLIHKSIKDFYIYYQGEDIDKVTEFAFKLFDELERG